MTRPRPKRRRKKHSMWETTVDILGYNSYVHRFGNGPKNVTRKMRRWLMICCLLWCRWMSSGEKFGVAVSCEKLVVRESGPQFDMGAYSVGPKDILKFLSSKKTSKTFVCCIKQLPPNVPVHHTVTLTQSVATNILKNLINLI